MLTVETDQRQYLLNELIKLIRRYKKSKSEEKKNELVRLIFKNAQEIFTGIPLVENDVKILIVEEYFDYLQKIIESRLKGLGNFEKRKRVSIVINQHVFDWSRWIEEQGPSFEYLITAMPYVKQYITENFENGYILPKRISM